MQVWQATANGAAALLVSVNIPLKGLLDEIALMFGAEAAKSVGRFGKQIKHFAVVGNVEGAFRLLSAETIMTREMAISLAKFLAEEGKLGQIH